MILFFSIFFLFLRWIFIFIGRLSIPIWMFSFILIHVSSSVLSMCSIHIISLIIAITTIMIVATIMTIIIIVIVAVMIIMWIIMIIIGCIAIINILFVISSSIWIVIPSIVAILRLRFLFWNRHMILTI